VETCRAHHTKLFFLSSPRFICDPKEESLYASWRAQMQSLLQKYPDVSLIEINTFTHPEIFFRRELFKDSSHLNGAGSEIFSRILAAELKRKLEPVAEHTALVE
jgi:hypothetical protein